MKILETRIMRGPNQWSDQLQRLIVQKIGFSEPDDRLLMKAVEMHKGLFGRFEYEKDSSAPFTMQFLQFLVCELQSLVGMGCEKTEVKPCSSSGSWFLIFSYQFEEAGVEAGWISAEIANHLIQNEKFSMSEYLDELSRLKIKYHIGPTSNYLLEEIKRRRIPFRKYEFASVFTLGYGNRQRKLRTAVADTTSGLGIEMAGDKDETKHILALHNCPVPNGILVRSLQELQGGLVRLRLPVVVKPLDGNHGRGVTTNLHTFEDVAAAFEKAKKISRTVIVEEFIEGDDYRFLVVNYKLVAVAKRIPCSVTGNGHSTIEQLIEEENRNPERGDTYEHVLARIKIDESTLKLIAQRGFELGSVLPAGTKLQLKHTANISAGGTAEDVTESVHPANRFMAERIARIFNLNICGVDVMASSVEVPITRDTGAIIEVNAGPGLRMHSNPQNGRSRDIAGPIIDMLFPGHENPRIPIVAVTGTNGKTTTTRLIAHLAGTDGKSPGYCTSDGVYINGNLLYEGDCTGSASAHSVLFDPSIDFAVLECARGGIIRSGLGFDSSDVAVVTNITEDHLGLKDIYTLEELTRVKRVVAMSVKADGYLVLNADDERSFSLKTDAKCKVALFSLSVNNERIREHISKAGTAAVIENDMLTIYNGSRIMVEDIKSLPLSFEGKADFMVANILAATLAAYLSGFGVSSIKKGLLSFVPSPEFTPGRMNLFDFGDFKMLVDYAHNSDGFRKVKAFMDKMGDRPKMGIISLAGDRREQDIETVGSLLAEIFDEVIIRNNKNVRGIGSEGVLRHLKVGIEKVNMNMKISHIPDELTALEHAADNAPGGALIFVCADKVQETLGYVRRLQAEYVKMKKAI